MGTSTFQPFYEGRYIVLTSDNGSVKILEPVRLSGFDLEQNKNREVIIVTKDDTLRKGKYLAQYPDGMLALCEETNVGHWLMDVDPESVKYVYPM